jgi:hypothetical protein
MPMAFTARCMVVLAIDACPFSIKCTRFRGASDVPGPHGIAFHVYMIVPVPVDFCIYKQIVEEDGQVQQGKLKSLKPVH